METSGRPLLFAVNGERVELPVVDPRTTVLQYLRSRPRLQGTKLGCGEGGCGACTVLLSKYDSSTKRVDEFSINSCLAPLCSIDGCAITTTEGLKSGNEYHAVHNRLSGFHGSQCGYCTPGVTMSIYSSLRKAAAAGADGPDHDHSNGTDSKDGSCKAANCGTNYPVADAEKCISGNICRCTGYRPILDTCKSFCGEVDVEDLGLNSFWNSRNLSDASMLPRYDPSKDPKFPSFLMTELEARDTSESSGLSFKFVDQGLAPEVRVWKSANSMTDLFEILKESESSGNDIKLVVGNTSAGVYKDMKPHLYVDIGGIPELQRVKLTEEGGVEVGAALSLTKVLEILKEESESKDNVVYAELAKHIGWIASVQVRNRGSVGGNLILAQQRGFDSDLATVFVGAGAEVTVASAQTVKTATLEDFLSWGGLEPGTILLSIRIPRWKGVVSGDVLFKTYRVSPRRNGNAVSYVNAGFLAVLEYEGEKKLPVVKQLRLAFGAFGAPHAVRAEKVEKLLVGKPISPGGLLQAVKELRNEIKSPASLHKAEYRGNAAVAFLFDFFQSFLNEVASPVTSKDAKVHEILGSKVIGEDQDGVDQNGSSVSNGIGGAESHRDSNSTANGSNGKKESGDGGQANGVDLVQNGAATEMAHENGHSDSSTIAVEFGSENRKDSTLKKKSKRFTPTFSASQKFATSKDFWPVGEPSQKFGVHLQAAGEAVYVDDVPPVEGTLYATYFLSDKQAGKIIDIDLSEARRAPGFVDFVSYKDIPKSNVGYFLMGYQGPIFSGDYCNGMRDTIGSLIPMSTLERQRQK